MVTLQKFGDSAVKFVFTDSDHYLFGTGEVTVPVNSLSLILDESDMVTFSKASTGDPYITFRADNSNLGTKAAIETFYKNNMVSSGGGGSVSGDVYTKSETDEKIAEATSGKADTSAVTADIAAAVSGLAPYSAVTEDIDDALEDYYDKDEIDAAFSSVTESEQVTATALNDLNDRADTIEQVTAIALNDLNDNKQDALVYYTEDTENKEAVITVEDTDFTSTTTVNSATIDLSVESEDSGTHYNGYASVGDAGIQMGYDKSTGSDETDAHSNLNVEDGIISAEVYANEETTTVNIYQDGVTINNEKVATEQYVDAAVSGKADTSAVTAISDSLTGYVQTSAITTSVTSGSTDSEIPTAKAVYDAVGQGGGGGVTYSAGTNISIDTGNTISCTLPITATTANNSGIIVNKNNNSAGTRAFAGGEGSNASGTDSFAFGAATTASSTGATAVGFKTTASVYSSFACGKWNDMANANTGEVFGSSGNTVFAVGNGWKQNDWSSGNATKHNALDVRQNGDIYIADVDETTHSNYYEKSMKRLQDYIQIKMVQISQADYDALVSGGTTDSSTLYIITGSNS